MFLVEDATAENDVSAMPTRTEMPDRSPSTIVCLSLAALVAGVSAVQQPAHDEEAPPTLPASIGRLHHPIRTTRSDAQVLFDRGLTLLYGFNRDAARRSFAAASRIVPDAAIAQARLPLWLGPVF